LLDRIQHVNTLLNQVIALKRRIIEDLRPSTPDHAGPACGP
jgi:signal transduction histidine kinase